jgi:hypothetical protein
MREFTVRGLGADVVYGTFVAVLAEYDTSDKRDGARIELHKAVEPDDEDDTDHGIIDEVQSTAYDAAEAWGAKDGIIVITLNARGRKMFEDDGWRLDLRELAPARAAQAVDWVARVLANVPRDDSLARASTSSAASSR